jgi:soluble lytic murein transglycosylase
MEWYDRAISTAERTRELHDFELRFLAPYRELAHQAANDNQIDEAWVFGLMRQESRFINVARSSVGASGLMQIMPATARWIAQRLGIKRFQSSEMQDPARNIQFGAYYLKHIQTSLDGSPVLATAAYNAGPGRAQRWRDSRPMEAAIYIESIPFAETRDYVKKVMSNAMYYAQRFGEPSVLLKDRLGMVPARKGPIESAPPAELAPETGPTDDERGN